MVPAGDPWAEVKATAGWSEGASTHTNYLRPADAVAPDRNSLVSCTILFLCNDVLLQLPLRARFLETRLSYSRGKDPSSDFFVGSLRASLMGRSTDHSHP